MAQKSGYEWTYEANGISAPKIHLTGLLVSSAVARTHQRALGRGIRFTLGRAGMGFAAADGQRQKFTQKERDSETGLDYFGARYYGSLLGRFTSADPLIASGRASLPQSWNRYAYALNHPLRLIDPDGLMETDPDDEEQKKRAQLQQQGQPAQTPPSSPSQQAGAQTPTGVTITVAMEANTMVNVPIGGAIIVPRLDKPTTKIQTHQMSIFSPTSVIMAIATHTRTLTNVDREGNLVNNVQGNRKVNNYRITDISPVTVIQKPMVMCPIRF